MNMSVSNPPVEAGFSLSGVHVLVGDALEQLRTLPDASVQCAVTSPPYFGLRSYLPEGHCDKSAEIGLEKSPDEYVAALVEVFREVRRVLADDGTLWLNLGDSYNNRTKVRSSSHEPSLNGFMDDNWAERAARGGCRMSINGGGLKEKDAFGIPWLVAFALRADGWYLRQEIIWAKSFGKPESVADRVTRRHEQIFLLSKSRRYYFDRPSLGPDGQRSVWSIAPGGFKEAHFATMPPALAERCILAGSRSGDTVLDPFAGSGTTGMVATQLGRKAILIELNPEYAGIIHKRISSVQSSLLL